MVVRIHVGGVGVPVEFLGASVVEPLVGIVQLFKDIFNEELGSKAQRERSYVTGRGTTTSLLVTTLGPVQVIALQRSGTGLDGRDVVHFKHPEAPVAVVEGVELGSCDTKQDIQWEDSQHRASILWCHQEYRCSG